MHKFVIAVSPDRMFLGDAPDGGWISLNSANIYVTAPFHTIAVGRGMSRTLHMSTRFWAGQRLPGEPVILDDVYNKALGGRQAATWNPHWVEGVDRDWSRPRGVIREIIDQHLALIEEAEDVPVYPGLPLAAVVHRSQLSELNMDVAEILDQARTAVLNKAAVAAEILAALPSYGNWREYITQAQAHEWKEFYKLILQDGGEQDRLALQEIAGNLLSLLSKSYGEFVCIPLKLFRTLEGVTDVRVQLASARVYQLDAAYRDYANVADSLGRTGLKDVFRGLALVEQKPEVLRLQLWFAGNRRAMNRAIIKSRLEMDQQPSVASLQELSSHWGAELNQTDVLLG